MKKSEIDKRSLARPLRINRETLRHLDACDLNRVVAAISGPSLCVGTTDACCVTR